MDVPLQCQNGGTHRLVAVCTAFAHLKSAVFPAH
jgi:hypothetical protein